MVNQLTFFSFFFLPTSIIAGNFVLNLNIVIFSLIIIFSNFNIIIDIIKKNYFFVVIFLILLLLNILFSKNLSLSFPGALGLIKNLIFCICIYIFFLDKKHIQLNILSKIIYCLIIFIFFDLLIQFFNKKDLFGFVPYSHGRLAGPFGDEHVAGSYIAKLFYIPLLFFFSLKEKKTYLIILLIIFSFLGIILSGDRMPLIGLFFTFLIFVFFNKNISLKQKFFFILIIFICFFANLKNKNFLLRFENTLLHFGLKHNEFNKNKNFLESRWGSHFAIAYEIGKKNLIFGSGIKTFRSECYNEKYIIKKTSTSSIVSRCNTHPHNIYLEIFSETGVLGFIFFLYIHLIILKKIILSREVDKNFRITFFCYFLLLFFPIQTTGSFFSSFNGVFYYIFYGLYLSFFSNLTEQKKNY